MKDTKDKFYDLHAEELLLAAAINIRKMALNPSFRPALFTGERAELAGAVISLARRDEGITEKHLELCGCGEPVMLAYGLIKGLEGYPDNGESAILIDRLADLAVRRHAVNSLRELHAAASGLEAKELIRSLNDLATSSQGILEGGSGGEIIDGSDINELLDEIRRRIENPEKITGLTTGMGLAFDRAIDGLGAGRLILIGGRPHLGKTSLGLQFASGMMEDGKSVAYFSAEMTKLHLQQAMLDLHSGVSIRAGVIPNKGELIKIRDAATRISRFKWHIIDLGRIEIDNICAKSRMLHRTKGLDSVVVDYAQIILGSDVKDDMRLMIAEISGKLKALSKELGIPVVLLSQINRATPRTDPKTGGNIYPKPALRDLKESSSLESDADICILIDRNLESEDPREHEVEADLIIAKNRSTGILCSVPVKFVRAHRAFRVSNHWNG
jgi:replicative DNA helicase